MRTSVICGLLLALYVGCDSSDSSDKPAGGGVGSGTAATAAVAASGGAATAEALVDRLAEALSTGKPAAVAELYAPAASLTELMTCKDEADSFAADVAKDRDKITGGGWEIPAGRYVVVSREEEVDRERIRAPLVKGETRQGCTAHRDLPLTAFRDLKYAMTRTDEAGVVFPADGLLAAVELSGRWYVGRSRLWAVTWASPKDCERAQRTLAKLDESEGDETAKNLLAASSDFVGACGRALWNVEAGCIGNAHFGDELARCDAERLAAALRTGQRPPP